MSYDPSDAAYDEFIDRLYEDFRELVLEDSESYDRVVEDFKASRLAEYYTDHPHLVKAAVKALKEARELLTTHPRSSVVLAVTASEVIFRDALLTPIVHGSFHTETTANLIAKLITSVKNDSVLKALHTIMAKTTGIDIKDFNRSGSTKPLWEEMTEVQKIRNRIIHRADSASEEEAKQAVCITQALIDDVFTQVIDNLGLNLQDDMTICWPTLRRSVESISAEVIK